MGCCSSADKYDQESELLKKKEREEQLEKMQQQIEQYDKEIEIEEQKLEESSEDVLDIDYDYEFNYFNLYHKGEYIRIALEVAKTPNGYLPTLKENGKVIKDQAGSLLRYICMKHGMYPTNARDRYKAERIVDIITSDCQFFTVDFLNVEIEDQENWCQKRGKKILPIYLGKINKNVQENIIRFGWAATNRLSIADVALLTWLSSLIFNPFFEDQRSKMLAKYPVLDQYWNDHHNLIIDYMQGTGIDGKIRINAVL